MTVKEAIMALVDGGIALDEQEARYMLVDMGSISESDEDDDEADSSDCW